MVIDNRASKYERVRRLAVGINRG